MNIELPKELPVSKGSKRYYEGESRRRQRLIDKLVLERNAALERADKAEATQKSLETELNGWKCTAERTSKNFAALHENYLKAEATIKEWQDAFVANTPQDYFDGIRPNDCPKGFEGVK